MTEEKRKKFFVYSNENPIKITNNNNLFNHFYLEDIIFCGGDTSTYNEIWYLEISQNPTNEDIFFKNFEKTQNRGVALFNPKFTYSGYNRDEGSLLVFEENRKISISNTNEISLYFRNINDGNLVDFKDLTFLLIYSIEIN